MNNRSDRSENHALIDGALADEAWSAFDSRLRHDALCSFAAAKNRRRTQSLALRICALLLLPIAVIFLTLRSDSTSKLTSVSNNNPLNPPPAAPRSVVSEQEMLAMFPPGSCLIAEINGQRQLVFLDPKLADKGFPIAASH